MKICVFSAHFGGGYGTGHSIKKEVDELISRGHEVLVVHSEKNIKSFVNKKIKYFYFQYSKIPFFGNFNFSINSRIYRMVLYRQRNLFRFLLIK